jgi:hypothetical protein
MTDHENRTAQVQLCTECLRVIQEHLLNHTIDRPEPFIHWMWTDGVEWMPNPSFQYFMDLIWEDEEYGKILWNLMEAEK